MRNVLANSCWDTFCVLDCMVGVWSTHIKLYFVSSLAKELFDRHKVRYILCPRWYERFIQHMLKCIVYSRWHGRGMINTYLDIFCDLAGMGVV
jgi:hypothetical protein